MVNFIHIKNYCEKITNTSINDAQINIQNIINNKKINLYSNNYKNKYYKYKIKYLKLKKTFNL